MLVQSVSNQNSFKANVHMDLKVQNACRQSTELRNFVEFLKSRVKCEDVYLSTAPVDGWRGAFDYKIMGQSIHRDRNIYDCELGKLLYDEHKNRYSFVGDNKVGFIEKEPVNYFNQLLYYTSHRDLHPLNFVV